MKQHAGTIEVDTEPGSFTEFRIVLPRSAASLGVASVFTDIAGFTSLAEAIEPTALGVLLNEYVVGMTDIVFAHEGTVAKIIGDALHVLFGAPGDQPDHAARAIACALDLDAFSETFRTRWREKQIALGATRIGVHAGPAIVGNFFGGTRFFDYTAYGDTINIASRLEAANKRSDMHGRDRKLAELLRNEPSRRDWPTPLRTSRKAAAVR